MGGIETHIHQLILGLLESTDYDIDLLFWRNYSLQANKQHPLLNKLQALSPRANKRVCYVTANGSILSLIKYFRKNISIVHTHGYKAGITARIIGLLTRTPIISTYHNGDPGTGKLKLYNLIDRISSFLSRNIAVNKDISNSLSRCNVISNFVSTIDKKQFHKEINFRNTIAFVGRLSHEKGPDIFAGITKEMNYKISAYGDGPMMKQLKESYPRIEFKGMCDMEDHWQEIRVLVMPSRYEGLPLAALEAMARGIPVIASNAGALPQLIERSGTGKTISLDNLTDFQDEIEGIMTQQIDDYNLQGEHLIDFIDKNYSRKETLPKIINQYKAALG